MITHVAKVGVNVADQDVALEFFTKTLGFEKIADQPMGPGARWIEVRPKGAQTALALWTPPDMKDRIGTFSGLVFSCDDLPQTYSQMCDCGVKFEQEPTDQPGGVMGIFKDPAGNSFVLRA